MRHSLLLTLLEDMQQVRGHVLFVLDMDLVQPQKMTKKYMHYALGISREMQREDFALGTCGMLSLSFFLLMFTIAFRVQQCRSLVICKSLSPKWVLLPSA